MSLNYGLSTHDSRPVRRCSQAAWGSSAVEGLWQTCPKDPMALACA